MNYEDWDPFGIYKRHEAGESRAGVRRGAVPAMMGADTLIGSGVYNQKKESLGVIKEIVLDMGSGRVGYVVLSFGGFIDMSEKLFAVPWTALQLDAENKHFVLNVEKGRFEGAPGFDKGHWPDMTDRSWVKKIHSYYETEPYGTGTSGSTSRRVRSRGSDWRSESSVQRAASSDSNHQRRARGE